MRRFIGVVAVLLACNAFAIDQPALPIQFTDVREIRAGVICYGGISLAIYMYGNARELHHLALASAALDCDAHRDDRVPPASCAGVTPGKAWDTLRDESVKQYYVALVDLWSKDQVRPRFVIDLISGTSAGGINGVFLAKALTHNGSIDGLREIWFREADISRLAGRPWPLRAAWRVLIQKKAALGGDAWLAELYRALKAMDAKPAGPRLASLLVPGQPVDLLVTATDFYGTERVLEIGDPATSSELRYDHVFRFSAQRDSSGRVDPSTDAFDETIDNIALAFAARSSASFPVAFPAIQLDRLHEALAGVVPKADIRTDELAERLFADRIAEIDSPKRREAAKGFAKNLFLVDGGVLNNYPFGIAHRRVSRRSPATETTRVYLYLEPDPRVARVASPADADGPRPLQMFWNAKTTIPGAQPISQELIDIARHNRSVARIREIIRKDDATAQKEIDPGAIRSNQETPSVASQVEGALGVTPKTLANPEDLGAALSKSPVMRQELQDVYAENADLRGKDPELAQIRALRRRVEEDAATKGLPLSEDAYKRLRVESVLEQFARVMTSSEKLCRMPLEYDGPRASLMQEIVHQWAARPEQKLTGANADPKERDEFLDAFDLGYLRRRLRFVNDWLNLQYPKKGEPKIGLTRDQVQKAQAVIARRVDDLSSCLRGACLDEVRPEIVTAAKDAICNFSTTSTPRDHASAIMALKTNRDAITALATELRDVVLKRQDKLLSELYDEFVSQTGAWNNEEAARAVLSRYLGFPYWDRVAYPYTAFSGIGDMTHIDITRMSPNDTKSLSDQQAAKLKGAGLGHFGAFFSRDGRELDYVWGRLDGAERLLGVLGFKDDSSRRTALFTAIASDEKRDAKVSAANLQSFCEKFGVCASTPAKRSP
jgi:predicted acylesterase/phospholipase RssA